MLPSMLTLLVCPTCNDDASLSNFPSFTAVAAHLAQYKFSLKTPDSRFNPNLKEPIPEKLKFTPSEGSKEWERGAVYAKAQNMARTVRTRSLADSRDAC